MGLITLLLIILTISNKGLPKRSTGDPARPSFRLLCKDLIVVTVCVRIEGNAENIGDTIVIAVFDTLQINTDKADLISGRLAQIQFKVLRVRVAVRIDGGFNLVNYRLGLLRIFLQCPLCLLKCLVYGKIPTIYGYLHRAKPICKGMILVLACNRIFLRKNGIESTIAHDKMVRTTKAPVSIENTTACSGRRIILGDSLFLEHFILNANDNIITDARSESTGFNLFLRLLWQILCCLWISLTAVFILERRNSFNSATHDSTAESTENGRFNGFAQRIIIDAMLFLRATHVFGVTLDKFFCAFFSCLISDTATSSLADSSPTGLDSSNKISTLHRRLASTEHTACATEE